MKAAPVLDWRASEDAESLAYLKNCVIAFARFCGRDEKLNWEYATNAPIENHDSNNEIQTIPQTPGDAIAAKLIALFVGLTERTEHIDQIKTIAASLLGVRKKVAGKLVVKIDTQLCVDLHLPDELGKTIYTPRMAKMVLGCLGATTSADGASGVCAMVLHQFHCDFLLATGQSSFSKLSRTV